MDSLDINNLSDSELIYLGKRISEAQHREAVRQEIDARKTCVRCKKRHAPKYGTICKSCRKKL